MTKFSLQRINTKEKLCSAIIQKQLTAFRTWELHIISTMQGHPSILHTVTRGESILCVEMNYTGLAHEVQKPFIPHSTHSPTPGAPAFTTGVGLWSRKVHLRKPQIGVMSLCSHQRSLADSHTQNAFPKFSSSDTGVPPGDRNLYNFKALKILGFFLTSHYFKI